MVIQNLLAESDLLRRVQFLLTDDQQVYLVGGAVRDFLLQREVHDYDFAVQGNARRLGRKVANQLGGDFFVLDDEHDTARVLVTDSNGSRTVLDFAGLRSADLEDDLRSRDFSINAIAASLNDPSKPLVDPCGGGRDLQARVLKACSPDSFQADPVRVLRAVRLAVTFHLSMTAETKTWLRAAVPLLAQTSAERKRDELFRILGGENPDTALRILDTFSALELLLPELEWLKGVQQSAPHTLDVLGHTLKAVAELGPLLDLLVGEYQREAVDLLMGMAVMQLGRYRFELAQHFSSPLNPERSHRSLLLFTTLYHDIAKPKTRTVETSGRTRFFDHDHAGAQIAVQRAARLALSNLEAERVGTVIANHMRVHLLAQTGKPPSRKAQYRFFRDTGAAGVDVCLMSLADTLATYGQTLQPDHWEKELETVRTLLEAWFERREEVIKPPRLLDGHDLQDLFGVEPGAHIGDLLESIREQQVEGHLEQREDAIQFARNWLRNKGLINGGN